MSQDLTFEAVISPVQSAIMAEGGDGGSVRIRFDAYNVDLNQLVQFRGRKISVIIKADDQTTE